MEFNVLSLVDRIPDEGSAYKLLEDLRWDGKPVCPHCGSISENHYFLNPENGSSRKTRTGAPSQRRVWKCRDCRKQFTVLVGTIFQGTKISVRTWVLVIFEMCSNKNGIAAREIERKYGLTPKSAWFMTHRIREAMKRDPMAGLLAGTIVADETWIGGKAQNRHKSQGDIPEYQQPVFSLIHKETGEVRSRVIADVNGANLRAALTANVDIPASTLHTDENKSYNAVGREFADHQKVNHTRRQYVNRTGATSNQAESYFSQLKRSLDGTHHHVSFEHLDRYLAEFDFRHTTREINDTQRMLRLLGQVAGRRLTYRPMIGR